MREYTNPVGGIERTLISERENVVFEMEGHLPYEVVASSWPTIMLNTRRAIFRSLEKVLDMGTPVEEIEGKYEIFVTPTSIYNVARDRDVRNMEPFARWLPDEFLEGKEIPFEEFFRNTCGLKYRYSINGHVIPGKRGPVFRMYFFYPLEYSFNFIVKNLRAPDVVHVKRERFHSPLAIEEPQNGTWGTVVCGIRNLMVEEKDKGTIDVRGTFNFAEYTDPYPPLLKTPKDNYEAVYCLMGASVGDYKFFLERIPQETLEITKAVYVSAVNYIYDRGMDEETRKYMVPVKIKVFGEDVDTYIPRNGKRLLYISIAKEEGSATAPGVQAILKIEAK